MEEMEERVARITREVDLLSQEGLAYDEIRGRLKGSYAPPDIVLAIEIFMDDIR